MIRRVYKIVLMLLLPVMSIAQITVKSSRDEYRTGLVLVQSRNFEEAITCFTNAIKENPHHGLAYLNRGNTYFELGKKDSAYLDWNYAAMECDSEASALINKHCDSIYLLAKQMPVFPGGEKEMMSFLNKNLVYPKTAREAGVTGKVYVSFVVRSDGKISHSKILRGLGSGLDEEALRVINLMPAWTPGNNCGKNISVRFNLPIHFMMDR